MSINRSSYHVYLSTLKEAPKKEAAKTPEVQTSAVATRPGQAVTEVPPKPPEPMTPEQRQHQVIVDFLNEVHNPVKDVRDEYLKSGGRDVSVHKWILGDARSKDYFGDVRNPNAICFKACSPGILPSDKLSNMIADRGINERGAIRNKFSDAAKAAGFTPELIQEFQNKLIAESSQAYHRTEPMGVTITDQEFLSKLYLIAEKYFKLKAEALQQPSELGARLGGAVAELKAIEESKAAKAASEVHEPSRTATHAYTLKSKATTPSEEPGPEKPKPKATG